jgi:P4 family phage/plasmid primase-like protien
MLNNKGIPTIGVRGIQFRSRIEAQWAYIFEKLEWDWEYEPIDLQGYIPDFIIKFDDNKEILIEIKGDTNIWNTDVYKYHKNKIVKSGWRGIFGILGGSYKAGSAEYWINIGKVFYLIDDQLLHNDLVLRKNNKTHKWSLGCDIGTYDILNDNFKDTCYIDDVPQKEFLKIWVEAKNKVQWKGIQNSKNAVSKYIPSIKNQKYDRIYTPIVKDIEQYLIHINIPVANDMNDIVHALVDKFSTGIEMFVENNTTHISECIFNPSNLSLATLAYKIFNNWTYYDTKIKSWFYCDLNNIWCETKKPIILKYLIQKILIRILSLYIKTIHDTICYDECSQIITEEKSKASFTLIQSLESTGFIDSIMKNVVLYLKDGFYEDYIDSKPYLLAFKNKLYDFRTKELRNIKPDDYIMTNTGYDYPECVDDENTYFINKYFVSLFPNTEMKDYVLDSCCSTLNGEKREQYFNIHTGDGSNSKTTFSGLYESVLGGYGCEVSPETFTKPKKTANDTGELYKAKGKRCIFTNEPEADAGKLQTAILKRIADDGGRKIIARALYGNPVVIPITFQLNMFCNNKPELSSVDGGIARRLRVVEWKMKFVDEPDPNNKYQAPLDAELMAKIRTDDIRNAFIRMLLDRWETRVSAFNLIPVPDEIKEASADFIDDSSRVICFIMNNYDLTNNEDDEIGTDKLYNHFVASCRNSKVSNKRFKDDLLGISGVSFKKNNKGRFYVGLRLKNL